MKRVKGAEECGEYTSRSRCKRLPNGSMDMASFLALADLRPVLVVAGCR